MEERVVEAVGQNRPRLPPWEAPSGVLFRSRVKCSTTSSGRAARPLSVGASTVQSPLWDADISSFTRNMHRWVSMGAEGNSRPWRPVLMNQQQTTYTSAATSPGGVPSLEEEV